MIQDLIISLVDYWNFATINWQPSIKFSEFKLLILIKIVIMVTKIKKGASKEEIRRLFEKLAKKNVSQKGFDAFDFCGTVKFPGDGLEIQKQLRNEWE